MKKKLFCVIVLALVVSLLSSCSLIVKDPEVDKLTVVLDVNGTVYTKGEVQQLVEEELAYQEYLYLMQYGVALDVTDPEIVSQVQDMVLESLAQQAVIEQKLAELGYLNLSPEEESQAQETANATYQSYVDSFVATYFADSDLPDDEKRAAAEEMMVAEGGYPTLEELLDTERLILADEKLYQEIIEDVTISEEEVRTAYEERVALARSDYEADPLYFDMDVEDGVTIYYYPAGYRYVKHILLVISREDQIKLDELNVQLQSKQEELSALQAALENADEASRDALLAEQDALEKELQTLQQEYDAVETAAFDALQLRVDEVQGKIDAGQDFDELIAQYGEDPGMTVEPALTQGYLIGANSTNYVADFQEAALALVQPGDVSGPVRSDYGIHFIKYTGYVKEGPVPFETVQQALEAEVLATKQNDAYYTVVDAWLAESDVKVYSDRLAD